QRQVDPRERADPREQHGQAAREPSFGSGMRRRRLVQPHGMAGVSHPSDGRARIRSAVLESNPRNHPRRLLMNPLPLHPIVVHLPIALAVLMPVLSAGLLAAWWRGLLPRRTWMIAVLLQGLLLVSGVVSLRTG